VKIPSGDDTDTECPEADDQHDGQRRLRDHETTRQADTRIDRDAPAVLFERVHRRDTGKAQIRRDAEEQRRDDRTAF